GRAQVERYAVGVEGGAAAGAFVVNTHDVVAGGGNVGVEGGVGLGGGEVGEGGGEGGVEDDRAHGISERDAVAVAEHVHGGGGRGGGCGCVRVGGGGPGARNRWGCGGRRSGAWARRARPWGG